MERNKFRKAIQILAESFGVTITPERIEIYYQHLGKIEENIFSDCINQLLETESFFPPIVKFFDIVKNNIKVPSQQKIKYELEQWIGNDTGSFRDLDQLKHPIYKMMAEVTGVIYTMLITEKDFNDAIKFNYHRIVNEYKRSVVSGEQLRLPANRERSIYPYASSKPKHIESGFKKLDVIVKQITGKDRRI